jgi:hypothetical protein
MQLIEGGIDGMSGRPDSRRYFPGRSTTLSLRDRVEMIYVL